MTELKWYRKSKYYRDEPERIQGMYIRENDIESVREAAVEILRAKGYTVIEPREEK